MAAANKPTCRCGAEMWSGASGWVCSECDAPIMPYDSLRKRPKQIDIDRCDHEDEPCEVCDGIGKVDCEECDGDGCTVCLHCGSKVDCEVCDGEGKIDCPGCGGIGW